VHRVDGAQRAVDVRPWANIRLTVSLGV